jgi:hypothetical protein
MYEKNWCEKCRPNCECVKETTDEYSTPIPTKNNKYMYIVGGLIIAFLILNKK